MEQPRHNCGVKSFRLSIRLRAVLGGDNIVHSECTAHKHKKLGQKLGPIVGKLLRRISVVRYSGLQENPSNGLAVRLRGGYGLG